MKVKIEKITVKREIDDDFSARESTVNEGIRIIGIYAEAEVSYPIGIYGERRLEWLQSGGLWGIEDDGNEEYLQHIEKEELSDLRDHLDVFNVDTSDFNEKIVR